MMTKPIRLGVLISGRGSNLQALIDACQDTSFPAEIAVVISNIPDVKGLQRAKAAGLECQVVDHKGYTSREAFEADITKALEAKGIELVCLAGFMRILTSSFVNHWLDRLINIHPSLLPAYKGLHTHERALMDGAKFSGCTVHFVRPDMDTGPIIIQAAVPILPDDTADSLSLRVLASEHIIYQQAVKWIAEGKLQILNNTVKVQSAPQTTSALLNPPA